MNFPLCTARSHYFEKEIQIDLQMTWHILQCSWDKSVTVEALLWIGQWVGNFILILGRSKIFSCAKHPDQLWILPRLQSMFAEECPSAHSGRGVKLTTHLTLLHRLRLS